MTAYVISSGVTTGYDLTSGDTLTVSSGGESYDSYLESGGRETVLAGGLALYDEVTTGAVLYLSSGAIGSSLSVYGGLVSGPGVLEGYIEDEGTIRGASLSGTLSIDEGGVASAITVRADGIIEIDAGGSAYSDVVSSGGTEYVYSGGVVSHTAVLSGGSEIVYSGATAVGVVVDSGGSASLAAVISSGQALTLQANAASAVTFGGVTVEAGGVLTLQQAEVQNSGRLTLAAGAAVSDVTVDAGGRLNGPGALLDYGNLDAGVISGASLGDVSGDYAALEIEAGGIAYGVTVYAGALTVDKGARLSGAILEGYDASVEVSSGGLASGVVVYGDYGNIQVDFGAIVSGTVLGADGGFGMSDSVYGSAVGTVISSGALEMVSSGGAAIGTVVSDGGGQIVYSGGAVRSVTVLDGGTETLSSGATATAVTISSGGAVDLSIVVLSGQTYTVAADPLASKVVISGVTIDAGGALDIVGADVRSGATLVIASGASADGVTVEAGGRATGAGVLGGGDLNPDLDYGLVSGATLGEEFDEGVLYVERGGSALDVTLGEGELTVLSGGGVSGVAVDGGGSEMTVSAGGVASATVLAGVSGQSFNDDASIYGSATGTLVSSGGAETVYSRGVSLDARVSSGGEQVVMSLGSAISSVVLSGGLEVVSAGAVVAGVVVSSGGVVDLAPVISSGQTFMLSGSPVTTQATLDGVTVRVGGSLDLVGADVRSSGILTLEAGAVASSVTVDAGGRLYGPGALAGDSSDTGLVSAAMLGNAVGDSGTLIVQALGIAIGVHVVDGELEVLSGGRTIGANLTGAGLDLVVSAGGVASTTVLLARAGAAVGPQDEVYGVAISTTVSAGGVELVESGGAASGANILAGGQQVVLSGGATSNVAVRSGGDEVLSYGATAGHVTVLSGGTVSIDAVVSAGQSLVVPPSPVTAATILSGATVEVGGVLEIPLAKVSSTGLLTLAAGAVAGGVSVAKGGTLKGPGEIDGALVSASLDAGVASGVAVGGGGTLEVASGGVASAAVVTDALVSVDFGGAANGTRIRSAGEQVVYSGASGSSAVVSSGGLELVYSGGSGSGGSVAKGGAVGFIGATVLHGSTIIAGAVAAATTSSGVAVAVGGIIDYGDLVVSSGGTVALGSGGYVDTAIVSAGGVLSGAGILFGQSEDYGLVSAVALQGDLDVFGDAYGVTVGDALGDSGEVQVEAGAVAARTILQDGELYVSTGGVATTAQVSLDGEATASSGGEISAATVTDGGVVFVSGGGKAVGDRIGAGGFEVVSTNGLASGTLVSSGGFEIIELGASVSGVVVSSGGGVDFAASLTSGQSYVLPAASGATALGGVTVSKGGLLELYAVVQSGATLSLATGAVLSGAEVSAGGRLLGPGSIAYGYDGAVDDFGLVSGVTVGDVSITDSLGILSVEAGGVAEGLTIRDGYLYVSSGGLAEAVNAEEAYVDVLQGGVTSNVVVGRAGPGSEMDLNGGLAIETTVSSGSVQVIYHGGEASGTILSAGGEQLVYGDGTAKTTTASAGSEIFIQSGAIFSGLQVGSGAFLTVDLGGYVASSGTNLAVGIDPVAETISGAALAAGGDLTLEDYELQSGAKVIFLTSGNTGDVLVDKGATLSGSGTLVGTSDDLGVVSAVRLGDVFGVYGELDVEAGGVANAVTVTGVGQLSVSSGGSASGAVVSAGGAMYVQSGGVASRGSVLAGGYEYVMSGATVSGTLAASGAIVDFDTGKVASGAVLVDGAVAAATAVSGVSLSIGAVADYSDYIVSSGGVMSVGAAGLAFGLTIRAGGVLSGQGALAGEIDDFGTVSGLTVRLTGDLYGELDVQSGGVASGVTVTDVASAYVFGGGREVATRLQGYQYVSSGAVESGTIVSSGGVDTVSSGAIVTGEVVSAGGVMSFGAALVSSGQSLTYSGDSSTVQVIFEGVTVRAGGSLELIGATVESGGVLTLAAGAIASGATVLSGGLLEGPGVLGSGAAGDGDSYDYGVISGVAVGNIDAENFGRLTIGSGGAAGGVSLYGDIDVTSGGFASGTVVGGSDSDIAVEFGGLVSGTVLGLGSGAYQDEQDVFGAAFATEIYSSSLEDVFGVSTDAIVFSGGKQDVGYGARAVGTTVLSGGSITLDEGATTTGVRVSSGGHAVFGGVSTDGTIVAGAVAAASTISGIVLSLGAIVDYAGAEIEGRLDLGQLGTGFDTEVDTGGVVSGLGTLSGDTEDEGTIIGAHIRDDLTVLGKTSGISVLAGGGESIELGGVADSTVVSSGGVQTVSSGGAVSGTIVLSGGVAQVMCGAAFTGLVVSSGGTLGFEATISAGQTYVLPATIAAATETISGATIRAGGAVMLQDATVLQSGKLDLAAGADVSSLIVSSGGLVSGPGLVTGELILSSGGSISGVQVASGATLLEIGDVIASGVTLATGLVAASTVVNGATLLSGATLQLVGTNIASGGRLNIAASHSAADVATLRGAILSDAGTIGYDTTGVTTLGGTLAGAGDLVVSGGGVLLLSGGGAGFTGDALIEAGTLEIGVSGGFGSGVAVFGSSGPSTLQIDAAAIPANGQTFTDSLQDFASASDSLDLRGLAYVSGATAKASGLLGSTLTVADGSRTVSFNLLGYAASDYTVQSDGLGGTLIRALTADGAIDEIVDIRSKSGPATSKPASTPLLGSGAASAPGSITTAGGQPSTKPAQVAHPEASGPAQPHPAAPYATPSKAAAASQVIQAAASFTPSAAATPSLATHWQSAGVEMEQFGGSSLRIRASLA